MKHGVPFDVAFSLPPEERTAFVIAIGELGGLSYDRATGTWSGPAARGGT